MKIAFHTLGCKVNQYETEGLKENFKKAGHEVGVISRQKKVYLKEEMFLFDTIRGK